MNKKFKVNWEINLGEIMTILVIGGSLVTLYINNVVQIHENTKDISFIKERLTAMEARISNQFDYIANQLNRINDKLDKKEDKQ